MPLGSNLRKIGTPVVVVVAALFLLFEEFVWETVARAVVRLARLELVARLEAGAARLNPYAAMALFALPVALVLPCKLYGTWLIVSGHLFVGLAVIVTAKLAGTIVLTRLFQVTRPQLMRVSWFARFYYWLTRTKQTLFERLHAMPAWIIAAEWLSAARRRVQNAVGDVRARILMARSSGQLAFARLRAARRLLRRAAEMRRPVPGE